MRVRIGEENQGALWLSIRVPERNLAILKDSISCYSTPEKDFIPVHLAPVFNILKYRP
jgi:hypothetical protein